MITRTFLLFMVAATSACAAGGRSSPEPVAGWYLEQQGRALFRPCGAGRAVPVAPSDALARHAREFGLQPDTPVYVRLAGSMGEGTFAVERVVQFGSPTPVRDCPLDGVVIEAPGR